MKKNKINLNKKKITVMGIGLHGGAVDLITWLSKQGARVVATDKKSKEKLAPSIKKLKELKNVRIVVGQHRMEDFESVDLVIKNPAIPWTDKYIQTAIKNKIPVEMDAGLFFELSPTKNIIGITGTKGKTTTSLLIYEILKKAGRKPIKVGIGQGSVISQLEKINKKSWVVFELSSWRLSILRRKEISPRYAVITNITQDHLNYYSSMEKYIRDKKAIFLNQKSKGVLVLNYDDEILREFENEAKGTVFGFSEKQINKNNGVFVEKEEIKYNKDGQEGIICQLQEINIRGKHNIKNILAASAICLAVDIPVKVIKEAVINFKGVPHRLEFVRKINEVLYYNDTTATTPASGIAGIQSFSRPINLIAGGSNKELDLMSLGEEIATNDNVKKVFLLKGAATEELKKIIEVKGGAKKVRGIFESMNEAIKAVSDEAEKGEIVLLSPGCASFGMFDNEFDRGEQFKRAVENL